MARKHVPEGSTPDPELVVSREEAGERIAAQIDKGAAIAARPINTETDLTAAKDDYRKWSDYNGEMLRRLFTTAKFQEEYDWWGAVSISRRPPAPQEELRNLHRDLTEKVSRLESIRDRLELIPVSGMVRQFPEEKHRAHTNRVFVVHGHDDATRETVARFLERFGIEAVILHEQATAGRTIIEKLEHYADVDFAVILLTPDDVGGPKDGAVQQQPRARQNVVLELGYFISRLGRQNVCALYRSPLELPSDYLGVGYVLLDEGGGWRLQLAKELRVAGFAVDLNLAM